MFSHLILSRGGGEDAARRLCDTILGIRRISKYPGNGIAQRKTNRNAAGWHFGSFKSILKASPKENRARAPGR